MMTNKMHTVLSIVAVSAAMIAQAVPMATAAETPMPTQGVAGFHPFKPHKKEAEQTESAPMFPKATRKEPGLSPSDGMREKLQQLTALDQQKQYDEEIASAQQIAAAPAANAYDRAAANQSLAFSYAAKSDYDSGIAYAQKALAENALSNNSYYQTMLVLAQMQVAQKQFGPGIATLDRLIAETGEDKPSYEALRGNALYQAGRYPEAIAAIQKAQAGTDKPDSGWLKIQMASYNQMNQPEKAAGIAEELLKLNPDDKEVILDLASIYLDAKQPEKAAALLDDARQRNLLTEGSDYRQLYSIYGNIKGREKDSIAVINDGLQKGILKPDAGLYTVLGQDYYFSGQMPQAMDAYRKADAVSGDGEAALVMAQMYFNQGQLAEAKQQAERALHKGIKNPEEARKLMGQSEPQGKKQGRKK